MKPYAALLLLPLLLSGCGDSEDGPSSEDGAPAANRQILEGTIDDSMIDLTDIESARLDVDESSSAAASDEAPPQGDSEPAAEADETADSAPPTDEAEPDASDAAE